MSSGREEVAASVGWSLSGVRGAQECPQGDNDRENIGRFRGKLQCLQRFKVLMENDIQDFSTEGL